MANYSTLSKDLTKYLPKISKKKEGIYFTPPEDINTILKNLKEYIPHIRTVLEPSCGSGEFLTALQKIANFDITAIEYNTTIFEAIREKFQNITLINEDFMKYQPEKTYDLIIGNPPYFVLKKHEVNKKYYDYFTGRPNIFILFIIHSLSMLNENGIVCFVLPTCFLNSYYYDKTRRYINDKYTILNIEKCSGKYIETQQSTFVLTIQNKENCNNQFIFERGNYLVFGTINGIKEIKHLYNESKSLIQLGFKASIGTVVWNQYKSILTDNPSDTRVIYDTDIINGKLGMKHYKNPEKKNYIKKEGQTHPILVIKRGHGKGKYKFDYCLIDLHKEYLIENHLICIKYQGDIERTKLMELYQQIIASFNNIKTKQFIDLYFCNGAVNTTELNENLPIYL